MLVEKKKSNKGFMSSANQFAGSGRKESLFMIAATKDIQRTG